MTKTLAQSLLKLQLAIGWFVIFCGACFIHTPGNNNPSERFFAMMWFAAIWTASGVWTWSPLISKMKEAEKEEEKTDGTV